MKRGYMPSLLFFAHTYGPVYSVTLYGQELLRHPRR